MQRGGRNKFCAERILTSIGKRKQQIYSCVLAQLWFLKTLDRGQQEGPPEQAGAYGTPEEATGVGFYSHNVKHLLIEERLCIFGGSCCAPASA